MPTNPLTGWWGKNKRNVIIGGVVVVVAWGFIATRDRPETQRESLPDGYASAGRELLVHASRDPSDPIPLVLILHDDSSDAAEIERDSDASRLADRRDFAVAYPEAVGGTWRGVTDPRGPDAQYLRDIVQYLAQERSKIDLERVYVWGYGEGGRLALKVACTGPDGMFAAVGVVGRFDPEPVEACPQGVGKVRVADESWTEDTTDGLWDVSRTYPAQTDGDSG